MLEDICGATQQNVIVSYSKMTILKKIPISEKIPRLNTNVKTLLKKFCPPTATHLKGGNFLTISISCQVLP